MAVHFTKREGKVVGMTMTFAETRFTYFKLTGSKLLDAKFQEGAKFLMENFSEVKIREVVESFELNRYLDEPAYVG